MSKVLIRGGGIAGQVLYRELTLRGISASLVDRVPFPRQKVCGGILQWDTWEYLSQIFALTEKPIRISEISHFWRSKRISTIPMDPPMVYISRFSFDHELYKQQAPAGHAPDDVLEIDAGGTSSAFHAKKGAWIGFQAESEPVNELQMHYGRGIYAGVAPLNSVKSHVAFIVKKNLYRNMTELEAFVKQELGIGPLESLKGTGGIHYGDTGASMAVGDAKMATHPFLGLGMKHAVNSARLMADLIEKGRFQTYAQEHRKRFRRFHWASTLGAKLYETEARVFLWPFLRYHALFAVAYRWVHR